MSFCCRSEVMSLEFIQKKCFWGDVVGIPKPFLWKVVVQLSGGRRGGLYILITWWHVLSTELSIVPCRRKRAKAVQWYTFRLPHFVASRVPCFPASGWSKNEALWLDTTQDQIPKERKPLKYIHSILLGPNCNLAIATSKISVPEFMLTKVLLWG